MKKITIILIIVFCLLSFMEISCLAQESWGKYWNNLSNFEKQLYLIGMADGLMKCISDFFFYAGSYIIEIDDKEVRKILTVSINNNNDLLLLISNNYEAIINIMDDLYKDPANTNIRLYNICFLACWKLKGGDIESSLREAREKALP